MMSIFTVALATILLALSNVAVVPAAFAANVGPVGIEAVAPSEHLLRRGYQAIAPRALDFARAILPRAEDNTVTLTVTDCETQPATAATPDVPGDMPPATTGAAVPPTPSDATPAEPSTSEVPPEEKTAPSSAPPGLETTGPSSSPTGDLVTDSRPPASTGSDTPPDGSTTTDDNPFTVTDASTISSSVPSETTSTTTTGQPVAPNSAPALNLQGPGSGMVTVLVTGPAFIAAALALL